MNKVNRVKILKEKELKQLREELYKCLVEYEGEEHIKLNLSKEELECLICYKEKEYGTIEKKFIFDFNLIKN